MRGRLGKRYSNSAIRHQEDLIAQLTADNARLEFDVSNLISQLIAYEQFLERNDIKMDKKLSSRIRELNNQHDEYLKTHRDELKNSMIDYIEIH